MTTPPYPDPPRCCEHTSNAHSRKHCLLCPCEKAPVVVNPRPEPTPDFDVEILHPCGVCYALTADREAHTGWHERQLNTMENLAEAVRRLAAATGAAPSAPTDEGNPT